MPARPSVSPRPTPALSPTRRSVAITVVVGLVLGAIGLTGTAPASAAPGPVFPTGTASWGLRDSFRWYLALDFHDGEVLTTGGVTWLDAPLSANPSYVAGKGPFSYPVSGGTYDPATNKGTIELGGTLQTRAHPSTVDPGEWVMDTTYSDLKIDIDGSSGTIRADMTFRPFVTASSNIPAPPFQTAEDVAFGTVDLSGQNLVPDQNGAYTITAAPVKGVASTMQLVGWNLFYQSEYDGAGVELSPLTLRFTPDAPLPRFKDVPPTHTFFDAIEWMAAEGLSTGHSDGTYRPTATVNRQAAAVFLWRLNESPDPRPGAPTFKDLPSDAQFAKAIRWLAGEGITTGYADGTFKPTAPVTRQGIATFLWRLEGEPAPRPGAPTFRDVPGTHQFRTAISWLAGEGIATGYADGTFKPLKDIARQGIASFLYKSYRAPV